MSGGPPRLLLELCAGAGQIGLLALALSPDPASRLVAVDADPIACEFIRRNAREAGLSDRVDVRHGNIDEVLRRGEQFDLILADPPWVERARVSDYPYDPVLAIDGGPDGLSIALVCLRLAEAHLREGASLLLQVGSPDQVAEVVRGILASGSLLRPVEARHFDTAGSLVRFVSSPGGSQPPSSSAPTMSSSPTASRNS
jgi:release factor glutamine methyltransferase